MGLLNKALSQFGRKAPAPGELYPWIDFARSDFLAFIEPLAGQKDSFKEIPFLYSQIGERFQLPPSLFLIPSYSGGLLTPMGYHGLNGEEAKYFRMPITEDLEHHFLADIPFLVQNEILLQNQHFHQFKEPRAPHPAIGFPFSIDDENRGILLFFGLDPELRNTSGFKDNCKIVVSYLMERLKDMREQSKISINLFREETSLDAWALARAQKIKQVQKTPYIFSLDLQALLVFFGEVGLFLDPLMSRQEIIQWIVNLVGDWGDYSLFGRKFLTFIIPGAAGVSSQLLTTQIQRSFNKKFKMIPDVFHPEIISIEIGEVDNILDINWDVLGE